MGDVIALLLYLALIATVINWISGCAASDQARQGTVELQADLEMPVSASLEAALASLKAKVTQEAQEIKQSTQTALVAFQRVDNSTSDKVVNRMAIVGVLLLGLSYPIGKAIWIITGKGRKAVRRKPYHPTFRKPFPPT